MNERAFNRHLQGVGRRTGAGYRDDLKTSAGGAVPAGVAVSTEDSCRSAPTTDRSPLEVTREQIFRLKLHANCLKALARSRRRNMRSARMVCGDHQPIPVGRPSAEGSIVLGKGGTKTRAIERGPRGRSLRNARPQGSPVTSRQGEKPDWRRIARLLSGDRLRTGRVSVAYLTQ
jgi:hypothetical protein